MTLASGSKLGPYEIVGPLGAGGMGEVYRARDTRLERTVAIKILPASISADPVAKQRFEREAKTISGLNHPNICVLHDVGSQDGVDYLVMECVEGETLAKRLEKGPLPLEQVLKIGQEIAGALDKAHRNGVVHRDLKPGNIMLTSAGAKLLDFGLARPVAPLASLATLTATKQESPVTEQGTIVGTFQYMSPEQIEGKELDGRSDIFSLGAVLYEMATGKRAFEGKSQISVASAILEKDPQPITASQPSMPRELDRIVTTCLAKNPDERCGCAHDLKLQLRSISEAKLPAPSDQPEEIRKWTRASWAIAAVCALAAIVLAGVSLHFGAQHPPLFRSYLLPPEKTVFVTMTNQIAGPPVVSPDGSKLAFVARDEQSKTMLYVQPLDALAAQPLAGTEGATYPFWSADSRSIGFFPDASKLKRIDVSGGPPQTVCENFSASARGGAWNATGTMLFGFGAGNMPLQRVSAAGGVPAPAAGFEDQEITQRWPQFLPDGKHFLFFVFVHSSKPEATGIYVGSLDSLSRKQVLRTDSNAQYVPPGYLLFVRDQTLMAQPFSLRRLETTGDPVPIAENLSVNLGTHRAVFSASDNGVLVFQADAGNAGWQLVWYDRNGKRLAPIGEAGQYLHPAISPDGTRVATTIASPTGTDIWIFDLRRGTKTRLTFGPEYNSRPVWTPDGKKIIFSSDRKRSWHIYAKSADNSGSEEVVLEEGTTPEVAYSASHDGRYIAFVRDSHIWALPLFGDRKPFPLTKGDLTETEPAISPDGKWVAYTSLQSGRYEIYVTSFPNVGAKSQISIAGAYTPQWRSDGKELYFMGQDQRLMAVDVDTHGGSIEFGTPHALFQASPSTRQNGPYAASDGKRFLINATAQGGSEPLTLVTNWTELLKK